MAGHIGYWPPPPRPQALPPPRHQAVPQPRYQAFTPQAEARGAPKTSGLDEVYIAVMGVTGAGKSKFISACTGQDVKVGHSLESCTTEVDDYTFTWRDKEIHLIDTPGFDDTHRSDREVLEGIASWLATSYEQNIKLSGILYLHRITDVRVGGVALRNLTMFKKLCGDDFYPRVFLVTTMWDNVEPAKGQAREAELLEKGDFWGKMVHGGAHVERHYGNRDCAMDILREVIRNRRVDAPTTLKVQTELVDEHKRLDETTAGRQFEVELLKQRQKHEREMKEMQEDIKELLQMNERRAAEETERQRAMFEQRIAESFIDQAKLKSSLDEIQKRQAAELQQMQEQVERDRAEYEEKIRQLERERSELHRMDSSSSAAQNLQARIDQDQADIARRRKRLNIQETKVGKAVKRYYIKGAGWVKEHPGMIKFVANVGVGYVFGQEIASQ